MMRESIPRVLHVTLRADFSGGPLYTYNLIDGLGQEIESYIACPMDRPMTQKLERLVGKDKLYGIPERSFNPIALYGLCVFVRRRQIDIIHSHGKGAGVYTRLASAITGVPAVHTFHGLHFHHYSRIGKISYRLFERLMSALSRSLIAVVDSEKTIAVAQGFAPAGKIVVIRSGVRPKIPLLASSMGGLVKVVHFTRFDTHKNFDAMIELAETALAAGLMNKLLFLVVGDGLRRREYEGLAERRGVNAFFTFLGFTPNPEGIISQCKALVSTSRWEGLPIAPLEAGQAGLFLALSRIPGHEELVLSESGAMLFDLEDRAGYAAVIVRLAQLQERSGGDWDHASALIGAFNYDHMVARHLELYRSIVSAPITQTR
jgi:glycosyltransferase involved in cell wall biosynthesis